MDPLNRLRGALRHLARAARGASASFVPAAAVLTVCAIAFPLEAGAQSPERRDDVEVMIAIDASESMGPAMSVAKSAANSFAAAMPADVAIGVTSFADGVTVLASPSLDRALVRSSIDSIDAAGDTALYDAIVVTRGEFTEDVDNKVLVLLSDGADEGSTSPLSDALAAAGGVRVESISLTTALTDRAALEAFGPVTAADDIDGLSAAFDRVAGLIVETVVPTTVPPTTVPPTTVPPTTVPPTTVAAAVAPPTAPPTTEPAPTTTVVPRLDRRAVPTSGSESSGWLWAGAAATFVSLALLGTMYAGRSPRVSRERLGVTKPRRASDFGSRATSAVDDALARHGRRDDIGGALAVAGFSLRPAEFVVRVLAVAFAAGVAVFVLVGPLPGIVIALIVVGAAWARVRRKAESRRAAFAGQLSDVLQLLTTALQSGHGLTQALESVAEEAEEPARSEFAHVLAEHRLGRDLSDAMYDLAERMRSKDLEWVVAAMDINRETGGNLSEILTRVGETIRERDRVARQVMTLTAEGRLSARILMIMPFLMLWYGYATNRDNFMLLTSGFGLVLLCFGGVLLAVGLTWVRKIVNSVTL